MSSIPALELLQATHQFPGPYMFKAIGREENGFTARVVAAVRDELGEEVDPPFSVREATGGRHVSVTLVPTLKRVEQVLSVYRRIRTITGLVVLF